MKKLLFSLTTAYLATTVIPISKSFDSNLTALNTNSNFKKNADLPYEPPFKVDLKDSTDLFRYLIWLTFMHPRDDSWDDVRFSTSPLSQLKTISNEGNFRVQSKKSSDPVLLFHNDTQLKNDLDQEQVMKSEGYSHSVTNTKSVTTSISVGFEETIKFSVAETKFSLNFSKSSTDTHSETSTVSAPEQELKVPPHSTRWVHYDVFQDTIEQQGIVSAELDPNSRLTYQLGRDNGSGMYWIDDTITIAELYQTYQGYKYALEFLTKDDYALKFADNGKSYVNLPVTYKSSAGRLSVHYDDK